MNNNFKITPFVKLNLLANGKPTYISVFDIQQIYEDTSGKGQEGVRIHFNNDEYTFVEGPLDKVMYAIDEVLNPDFYKEACDEELNAYEEEPRPVPNGSAADNAILEDAAHKLKNYCKDTLHCADCIFRDSEGDYVCKLHHEPNKWDI